MAKGRADSGAVESIVSAENARQAVLSEIGKMFKITPVIAGRFQVRSGCREIHIFMIMDPPRTVTNSFTDRLALLNIEYLVGAAELAVEIVLIDLPVLRLFRVDTKTLMREHRSMSDGSDCELAK